MKQDSGRPAMPQARKALIAAVGGIALTLGVVAAFAQPGGGAAGMHGGAPFEMMIPKMLGQAKASLNLSTQQQTMWDAVAAQGKTARQTAWANRQQVKAALTAELAKAEPDLAAVAAVADSVEQQNRALHIAVRNQWLQLYASFTPEQKGVVRGLMQQRLTRMESLGAKMRERFQSTHPASGS